MAGVDLPFLIVTRHVGAVRVRGKRPHEAWMRPNHRLSGDAAADDHAWYTCHQPSSVQSHRSRFGV